MARQWLTPPRQMAGDSHKDLAAWIPHLIAVWRRARSKKGTARSDRRGGFEAPPPDDALTPNEVKEVAAGVKRLSLGLTRERALAGARYMDDPALLGAYLLFYWPVSYAQAREALGELPHRPGSVLDLGSGPGPLAFACLDAGARDVTAAERSKSALELAKLLAVEAATGLSTREWSAEQSVPEGSYELVTLGHLLNELGDPTQPKTIEKRAALVEQAAARLKPNGTVLILEPALRDTSRALLQVRDLLVARGYAVRAPCMWRGNCPALVRESDWCHAERTWKPPALVEELARAAALHKEALKMSYLALTPKGEAWPALPEGRLFRVVSEPLEGKGRVRYMACGPEGRLGLALQERHANANTEVFFKLRRGDVVRIDGTEAKGDGLGLTDSSTITRIAWAGQPLKG